MRLDGKTNFTQPTVVHSMMKIVPTKESPSPNLDQVYGLYSQGEQFLASFAVLTFWL